MISLKRVTVKIQTEPILENVTLDFEERQVHLLMGPTGAGKTTLLSTVMGFITPVSGEVTVPRGRIEMERERMGILFQFPEDMFFQEKVFDEVALAPLSRRMDRIEEKVLEAIKLVDLEPDILGRSPYTLSYGEKRRVALASILAFSPEWILLDEPLAGLDPEGRRTFVRILSLLKGNKGVIIASHRIEELIPIVDTITLLVDGKVVFSSDTCHADWNEVYKAGCDVPISVKFAMELASRGIGIGYPVTIEELIKRLNSSG